MTLDSLNAFTVTVALQSVLWKYTFKNLIRDLFVYVVVFVLKSQQQLRSYGEGPRPKVSSDRLVKPGIELATPGLQGKWPFHYTKGAPTETCLNFRIKWGVIF